MVFLVTFTSSLTFFQTLTIQMKIISLKIGVRRTAFKVMILVVIGHSLSHSSPYYLSDVDIKCEDKDYGSKTNLFLGKLLVEGNGIPG